MGQVVVGLVKVLEEISVELIFSHPRLKKELEHAGKCVDKTGNQAKHAGIS